MDKRVDDEDDGRIEELKDDEGQMDGGTDGWATDGSWVEELMTKVGWIERQMIDG